MIQSLTLKNFRSWKEGHVEFCDGVNIIVGENDNGKTNILRAINLIANNRPLGEDFRSNWGGDCEVKLKIDDKVIERIKTDKLNQYKMTGYDQPFEGFNKAVPDPIKQFLNLSDINIGFQLDGPFLLGKSPSDVAKYYNEAVNLDIIDRSIANIKSTLREEKAKKGNIESDIKKHEEDLEKLSWLDEVEPKIVHLEKLQKLIENKAMEFSILSDLIQKWNQQEEQLIKLNKIVSFENQVKTLENLYNSIEKALLEYNLLDEYIEKIKQYDDQILKIDKILLFENQVNKLLNLDQEITVKTSEYNELGKFIVSLKGYNQEEIEIEKKLKNEPLLNSLIELNQNIEVKTFEYNELLDYIKNIKFDDDNIESLSLYLEELELQYQQEIPNLCPVLEIECQKLIEIKQKNL